jgi:hypothetical protein
MGPGGWGWGEIGDAHLLNKSQNRCPTDKSGYVADIMG